MSVTIREIAQKLDLSIGAVSHAMNGYPDISEETRQRVLQMAAEMGYVPNRAARQLRRKKADAVGFILPSSTPRFADPFFNEFVAGLGDETARHPFDLLISIAPPGEAAERSIYQNWVQGRKVDGFILTHLRQHDWRSDYLSREGMHFTALGSHPGVDSFPRIEIDRQSGIMELVAHLVAGGFRRIACIGGPADLQIQVSQLEGYRLGLESANLPFDPDLLADSDMTSTSGHQAARQLLALATPPDAILCINDETAMGALQAAHEKGLRVGRDLAVAGFEGAQVSRFTDPPLTTLDVPVYEIACQLVKMLVAEISGQPLSERQVVLRPRLLVRASSAGTFA